MYTDKVLAHFKNPSNQGVLDNPSAVGEKGNPVCLLGDESIYFNGLFVPIKMVKSGGIVYSHDCMFNKVSQKVARNYKGKIITLKNCLGKVALTPDHLVLALKLPQHYKYFRTKHKQSLTPSWYHARDLKQRDIVLYPLNKQVVDIKSITPNIIKKKFDFKSIDIPASLPLNSATLRLFGYFVAEGNIQEQAGKTYISFTLHIKETSIAADIKNIVKKLFGLNVVIKEKPDKNTLIVYLYNVHLARFFKELFGNGAANKKLPNFLMDLPLSKQKHLIKALWLGDGYINLQRKGSRAGYATISYQLAQQIKTLLLRQKIACSIYIDPPKTINNVVHQQAYRIHVGQQEALTKISGILGVKYTTKSYQSITSWFDANYFYVPITGIEGEDYNGQVHNLEVERAHSFISDAFTLHNCGDIMKMYIQVGQREQNGQQEEYLEDIRFETLGCAAAIAVSSALTDLAKNKSLQEVLALTREDVINDLGGLPAPKIHCSMLGVDALHEAVNDYLKKEGKEVKNNDQKEEDCEHGHCCGHEHGHDNCCGHEDEHEHACGCGHEHEE